jgi:hypothetical protein
VTWKGGGIAQGAARRTPLPSTGTDGGPKPYGVDSTHWFPARAPRGHFAYLKSLTERGSAVIGVMILLALYRLALKSKEHPLAR